MKKVFASIVIVSMSLCAHAQQELTDTMSIKINQQVTPIQSPGSIGVSTTPSLYQEEQQFKEYQDSLGLHTAPVIYFPGIYPGQSSVFNWRNGGIVAAGRHETYPGLMNQDSAVLNFYQQVGDFSFTAYGSASKIGYFNGLATQWGYGGSMTYHVNDGLSFTAFGSYATQLNIRQPAILGFVSYPTFGGYADYRFGDSRFGVQVGAQSYYSVLNQHWQAQPIVTPYFKLGNGAKLGVDVGGILYNVFRDSGLFNKQQRVMNGPAKGPAVPMPRIDSRR
jgi:hypothetical protein